MKRVGYKRTDFLNVLSYVGKALSTKGPDAMLSTLCFHGGRVTAYNGVVAIQAELDVPIEGCIIGRLIIDMLKSSGAKDVVVSQDEKEGERVCIKLGRSRLKLSVVPVSEFPFKAPKIEGADTLSLTDNFRDAIGRTMLSVSLDETRPEHFGVTVCFSKKEKYIYFYSSDDLTLTESICALDKNDNRIDRVITLPAQFCELLDTGYKLHIGKRVVLATTDEGFRIYSRLIRGNYLKEYRDIISYETSGDFIKFPIPGALSKALSRACVLLDGRAGYTNIAISSDDSIMFLSTVGIIGDVKDFIRIKHLTMSRESVFIRCDPKLLLRALSLGRFIFIDKSIWLKNNNVLHLISPVTKTLE